MSFTDDFFEGFYLLPRSFELLHTLTEHETRALLLHTGYSQESIDRHYPLTSKLTHEEEAELNRRPLPDDERLNQILREVSALSADERAAKMKELIETEGLDPDFFERLELTPEAIAMHDTLLGLARQVAKTEEDTGVDIPRDLIFKAMKLRFDHSRNRDYPRGRGES